MTEDLQRKEMGRRRFIISSAVTGLTLAAGGAMGYVIARDEGDANGAPAGLGGKPGPRPSGKVTNRRPAAPELAGCSRGISSPGGGWAFPPSSRWWWTS